MVSQRKDKGVIMITENDIVEILNDNIIPLKVNGIIHYDINFKAIAKAIIDKIEEDKVNEDDIYHDWKVKHPGL
jgi:hypothetical protein